MVDRLDQCEARADQTEREKREVDVENNEIKSALEDAESAIEAEEAKVSKFQVELAQGWEEIKVIYIRKCFEIFWNFLHFSRNIYNLISSTNV